MISLTEGELKKRHVDVLGIVEPLIKKSSVEIRQLGAGTDYVIGLLSKGVSPRSVDTPENVRVPTRVGGVYLNYHERWRPIKRTTDLELERAYLHLYLPDGKGSDTQILCFHCEPTAGATGASAAYKNGPHFHVGGGNPNISKAHISVCVNDESQGGVDAATLSDTMRKAVRMIDLELLPRYANGRG